MPPLASWCPASMSGYCCWRHWPTGRPTAANQAVIGVIPLPIDPMAPAERRPLIADEPTSTTVGIFGYLYPGKGHREVLEELTGMDPAARGRRGRPRIGSAYRTSRRADDGCAPQWDRLPLHRLRSRLGTAADPAPGWRSRLLRTPTSRHPAPSTPGSPPAAGHWFQPEGTSTELDQRLPGAVWIYQPGELRQNVERAAVHPDLTWLPTGLDVGPTTAVVAGRFLDWVRILAGLVS